jgi:hypothetical protein
MANVFNARQTGPITAVALAPVNDSYYKDLTLEPPMVRIRSPNTGDLYCSSADSINKSIVPNNVVVGTPGDGIMMQKIKRMSLKYIVFRFNTDVINSENNTLLIYKFSDKNVYTLTIPTGNWNTPQLLMRALQSGLVSSGLGVSFTYNFKNTASIEPPVTRNNEVLIVASAPILFLQQSSALRYGGSTYGFPGINTPLWNGINPVNNEPNSIIWKGISTDTRSVYDSLCFTAIKTGAMPCVYTRYVDIYSSSLTRWTKLPSVTSKSTGPSFIYRFYFETFQDYPSLANGDIVTVSDPTFFYPTKSYFATDNFPASTWTLNTEENISTVSLEFRDEYGRQFLGNSPYIVNETTPGNPATITNIITPDIFNGEVAWDLVFAGEL